MSVTSFSWNDAAVDETSRQLRSLRESAQYVRIKAALHEVLCQRDETARGFSVAEERYRFGNFGNGSEEIQRRITGKPSWVRVLNLEEMGFESEQWRIQRVDPVPCPEAGSRALVTISWLGGDRHAVVEVDLAAGELIAPEDGGYSAALGTGGLVWIDGNSVLAFCSRGDDELTHSGHPRKVRLWRRGQQLEQAAVLGSVGVRDRTITAQLDDPFVLVIGELADGARRYSVVDLSALSSVALAIERGERVFLTEGRVYIVSDGPDGCRIDQAVLRRDGCGVRVGVREEIVRLPEHEVVRQVYPWRGLLAVVSIVEGAERVHLVDAAGGIHDPLPRAVGSVRVSRCHEQGRHRDDLLITWHNLMQPMRSERLPADCDISEFAAREKCSSAMRIPLEAHQVVSDDGSQVRYFVARPRESRGFRGGPFPTLLMVYGGFGVPFLPSFVPEVQEGWLAQGGAAVVAQVRGGGERGSAWSIAGRGPGKLAAVEDLRAVAEDLFRRRICTAESLVCEGTSNGGLLVTLFLQRHPKLCAGGVAHNAVVDLSDYDRLPAGIAWRTEYGPNEGAEWETTKQYSPLHQVPATPMPPLLLTAEANDDRVDPIGAGRLVRRMRSMGQSVLFRMGRGSHRGAADVPDAEDLMALTFTFLWKCAGRK